MCVFVIVGNAKFVRIADALGGAHIMQSSITRSGSTYEAVFVTTHPNAVIFVVDHA
jgi:hypothetical protein